MKFWFFFKFIWNLYEIIEDYLTAVIFWDFIQYFELFFSLYFNIEMSSKPDFRLNLWIYLPLLLKKLNFLWSTMKSQVYGRKMWFHETYTTHFRPYTTSWFVCHNVMSSEHLIVVNGCLKSLGTFACWSFVNVSIQAIIILFFCHRRSPSRL
jgi:hypothetical protein